MVIKTFIVTAYCACKVCCGPHAHGVTASGVKPIENISCSAPRSIPFDTILYIEGLGYRVVHDRASRKYDDRIDIYFSRHSDAKKFGKRKLRVFIPDGTN